MQLPKLRFLFGVLVCCAAFAEVNPPKPKLTLDEFFNSVSFNSVALSPDGNSVVIGTDRADWDQQIFRHDLWLYRVDGKSGSLTQLTQSGHDTEPKWSPDGRWIAFLSERKSSAEKSGDSSSDARDESPAPVYLISPSGGEAFAITEGEEEVHAFDWSADSQNIYFATRQPWTHSQKDDYKKNWKDVLQYRTAERGDAIFLLNLPAFLASHPSAITEHSDKESDKEKGDLASDTQLLATTPFRVDALLTSPDGRQLAFLSNSINQRQENNEDRRNLPAQCGRDPLADERKARRKSQLQAHPAPPHH